MYRYGDTELLRGNLTIHTTLAQGEFLQPRYWMIWLGIGLMRVVCGLSPGSRWAVGSFLGRLTYYLARRRRHIVSTNLGLCFPRLTDIELRQLVKDNFRSSGISLVETALAWFGRPDKSLVDMYGLEHLREAQAQGRGVILLGVHLSSLDFCGAVLASQLPFDIMYRRNKNRLLEAVMTNGRRRHYPLAIERGDVRQVINRLKSGHVVWYGPDQDYGRKHSIFAPLFGIPAATITATSRIARLTGSKVVFFSHYRQLDSGRYAIHLSQPLAHFPGPDQYADCARINALVEAAIRVSPEQYWWLHRRFKTRPDGEPRPY